MRSRLLSYEGDCRLHIPKLRTCDAAHAGTRMDRIPAGASPHTRIAEPDWFVGQRQLRFVEGHLTAGLQSALARDPTKRLDVVSRQLASIKDA